MMGPKQESHAALFYEFSLKDHAPLSVIKCLSFRARWLGFPFLAGIGAA